MQRREELVQLLLEHIQMTSAAVLISICIGIPLGIFVTKNKKASSIVIGIANIMQSIPSIGLLAFLVPVVGIGQKPAIIMVIIYALLPIIKNTYIGITGIQQSAIESASSIGLTKWRILYKIQIPIAMPYIMAGVRISAVTAVGTVTIAAFAGAGERSPLASDFAPHRAHTGAQLYSGAAVPVYPGQSLYGQRLSVLDGQPGIRPHGAHARAGHRWQIAHRPPFGYAVYR